MASSDITISPGEARSFSVAGLRFSLGCDLESSRGLRLPWSYRPFVTTEPSELSIRVSDRERLDGSRGTPIYDSKLHWRALDEGGSTIFELVHPPSSLLYCRAEVREDPAGAQVLLSKSAWAELSPSRSSPDDWEIPCPLDQLLLIPALARRGALLFHASGAAISDRSFIFAGHSGDGKTTLSGLLSKEGIPLLSDERIAIQKTEQGFVAYGTPWPGEGNVVSNAGHPLAGLFLLRKASRHSLGQSLPSLAAELLARAIVPYYLPRTVNRILDIFSDLAAAVPLRELHFAREPGIAALLRGAA